MSESRVLKTTEISEIDQSFRDNYEQKLAETLRDLRDQYESEMKVNREEIINLYETKVIYNFILFFIKFWFMNGINQPI